jgi:hypothetical protein
MCDDDSDWDLITILLHNKARGSRAFIDDIDRVSFEDCNFQSVNIPSYFV